MAKGIDRTRAYPIGIESIESRASSAVNSPKETVRWLQPSPAGPQAAIAAQGMTGQDLGASGSLAVTITELLYAEPWIRRRGAPGIPPAVRFSMLPL